MAAALILVASACTGSSSVTPPAAGEQPSSSVTTSTASTAPALSDEDLAAVGDPTETLSDAIAAVGTRYEFDTTVELTGGTLTLVSGRVYDDSSAYLVTTVGSELEYVITPEGRWVREPDTNWIPLQDAVPVVNPLASLAGPRSVDVIAVDGAMITLTARYDGSALGFEGIDTVDVEFVVDGDRLATLRYQAPAGDDTATVETQIAPTTDIAPVVPPITG